MSRASFIASITGKPQRPVYPDIASIIRAVSREMDCPEDRITAPGKGRVDASRARQEVMRRAYATGHYSLPEIGRALGRDHTSVLHGIRAASQRKPK